MKSLARSSILALVFFSFFISLAITSGAEAQVIGSLTYVEGRVDILHSGEAMFSHASKGDSVFLKDVVRTRADGKAKIELTNGNILSLAPFTRIDMEEYLAVKERTGTIKLSRGKVRVTTPKKFRIIPVSFRKEPAFEVHTPTATVGVRGSDAFIFFFNALTGAIFTKGSGFVYSINFPEVVQKIGAGEAVFASAWAPASPPRPTTKSERAIHAKAFEPAEEGEAPAEEETPVESGEYIGALEIKAEITGYEMQERMVPTLEVTALDTRTLLPVTATQKEETVETPEARAVISGTLYDGLFWFYSGGAMTSQGSISGTLTGDTGNWTDGWGPVSISATFAGDADIGLVKTKGTATGSTGSFQGYAWGIGLAGDTWEGSVLAAYIGPNQNAGYLIGPTSGSGGAGTSQGTANVTPVQMNSGIGIAPENLADHFEEVNSHPNIASATYGGPGQFSGSFTAGGSLMSDAALGTEFGIIGQDWGALMMKWGGVVASGTTSNTWDLNFETSSGLATPWDDTTYVRTDFRGSAWSGGELEAIARGYWYSTNDIECGIIYAKTSGTYSAHLYTTFQALTYGYWIDADKYWNMLQSESDKARLAKLDIPVTEVYATTLTGGSGAGWSNVQMPMKFLGASSGASRGLWSSTISGNYSGMPAAGAEWVDYASWSSSDYCTISGRQWSGGKFSAEVHGGYANNDTTNFQGAVFGTYGAGSFSGYGGGNWQPH